MKKTVMYIQDGKIKKQVDLNLVDKITDNLENVLRARESFHDRRHIEYFVRIREVIKELDKEQLEYLVNNLLSFISKYAYLFSEHL